MADEQHDIEKLDAAVASIKAELEKAIQRKPICTDCSFPTLASVES